MPTPHELYQQWLADPALDEETRAELLGIAGDEREIAARFGGSLRFGTGGLRGIIGAGTNRMNRYVVARVTQALAEYLLASDPAARDAGVAIAHDSRRKSRDFALETASVLAGNGIVVHLFDDIRPTPELSFAVRHLGAAAGVIITASHNPPEYNGYKVYGPDGGQMLPDPAGAIADRIPGVRDVQKLPIAEAERRGLLRALGADLDAAYTKEIANLLAELAIGPAPGKSDPGLAVLYTPLHGAGYRLVPRVIETLGLCRLAVLPEQARPDGDFPTTATPNPEDPAAFALALSRAKAAGSPPDLIIATDPDCDRVGVMERGDGDYHLFNGNEVGTLLADFLLAKMGECGRDPGRAAIVKTIVTTEMIRALAAPCGVEVIDTLTGFKYIGAKIGELERAGRQFLFGLEESCGYLAGGFVRDKDAVIASALIVAMAAHHRQRGTTLAERLEQLRRRYGYYLSKLLTIPLGAGEAGEAVVNRLRGRLPAAVAGHEVREVRDYLAGSAARPDGSNPRPLHLPRENAIQLLLAGDHLVTLRPSGTEPKVKIYLEVKEETRAGAETALAALADAVRALVV